MSFQEEWQRKKEERSRRRGQDGPQTNGSMSISVSTRKSANKLPEVQLKQTPKSPSVKMASNGQKELNEAEKKAEELRLKREQERLEAEQRAIKDLPESSTPSMTPERKAEIRRAKEERERLEREKEEERKIKAEEDARQMREEIQRRRQEAEAKRKQAQQSHAAYATPKYNIADNIAKARREKTQTSSEMQAEREKKVEESLPQIRISARDSEERLLEIAEMLHAKLVEVYGEMYDLTQRKERQDYDLHEMNARIKDLNKHKTVTVTTVDRGHVSMLKEKGFGGDDKVKQKQTVDVKASLPSTANIADRLQQLQSNLKKDVVAPEKTPKLEPIKRTYSTPEQLKEELEQSKREAERLKQQREENRKKREEELKVIEQYEEERRKKALEEQKKQAEERERLKKEKEEKEKARKALMSSHLGTPGKTSKIVLQKKKNREETIADRIPAMKITATSSDKEMRDFLNDIYNQLKNTLADTFDLQEQQSKNEYYLNELSERVGYIKNTRSPGVVNTGLVSKLKDGGWAAKKQNDLVKSPKPKELGIASEGGVKGRLAMFAGGGKDSTDSRSPPKGGAPAKVNIYK